MATAMMALLFTDQAIEFQAMHDVADWPKIIGPDASPLVLKEAESGAKALNVLSRDTGLISNLPDDWNTAYPDAVALLDRAHTDVRHHRRKRVVPPGIPSHVRR